MQRKIRGVRDAFVLDANLFCYFGRTERKEVVRNGYVGVLLGLVRIASVLRGRGSSLAISVSLQVPVFWLEAG